MIYWTAAFAILYCAGLLLGSIWPVADAYTNTMILAALGLACLLNFGRHRTLHCGITGPLFLLAAGVMAVIEAGLWPVDIAVVWVPVAIGVAVACAIEWRVTGRGRGPKDRCAC